MRKSEKSKERKLSRVRFKRMRLRTAGFKTPVRDGEMAEHSKHRRRQAPGLGRAGSSGLKVTPRGAGL